MSLNSFNDIQNIVYINLSSRTDRNEYVSIELNKLLTCAETHDAIIRRFNAVKLPHTNSSSGALGCSMSHLKCIEMAKRNNWTHVFICEDDITFLNRELLISQINQFLQDIILWDVLIIGGNNMLPYKPINDNCIQVLNCLTTTGYIVKEAYYDTLIENYREGIQQLMRSPEEKAKYAIDKYWLNLQKKDNWFMLIPSTVVQKEDYSDIEEKVVNFQKYMLNHNKCIRN